MAEARYAHAVAVLDGKLYAVGGFSGGDRLSSVERYDSALNAWEAVAPMASARCNFAMAVLDGKLYAVGGVNVNGDDDDNDYDDGRHRLISSVERYDPALDAWEAGTPIGSARAGHCSALL